ncbi:MAG: tetratricopeptide repeat protein, partial [Anaeromyxobacteraceae bacterium]
MTRAGGEDEVEGLDEEFLFHLRRGSDLLGRGDAEGARTSLERARELRAKDAKVLGLLGQAYHKLNRFDEAADVWHRVVDDNPVEPAARVNYGLSCLKARRYPEAIKQLEIAVDLSPEHRKAMGYLGLAYMEAGYPAEARGWFLKAGSGHMAARCDELIAKGEA